MTPHPPIGPVVPIDPVSPGPPVRPLSARRAGGAERTGGTGAAWRTGRAHLDAVRLELDIPCPHIVDLHLMGDERARLSDKRDEQGGAKHEGAPLKQFLFYVSHMIPHATRWKGVNGKEWTRLSSSSRACPRATPNAASLSITARGAEARHRGEARARVSAAQGPEAALEAARPRAILRKLMEKGRLAPLAHQIPRGTVER